MPNKEDGGVEVRGFSCHLTAAVLLTHALLGCCWHHAHACGDANDRLAVAGWQHQCDAEEDASAGSPDRLHHRHDRDDCRGTRCSFLATAKSSAGIAPPGCHVSVAFALPASNPTVSAGPGEDRLSLVGLSLLPVRLHLLHQVLLI